MIWFSHFAIAFKFYDHMDRIVRQIYPERRESEGVAEQRLSSFLTQPNIVLLGDPGAGKSYVFRQLAATCGGRYCTVRAFLTLPVQNTREVLFIDGLDERRGGRGDRVTIDALAARLIEADPAAVRISCRVADWLGKSDLVSLEPYFDGRGGVTVVALEALTSNERLAVLTENGMSQDGAAALLREAEERGLAEFLDNPQNLLLLRRAVQSGAWPETRRDLFEMATRLMLQEQNSERARTGIGIYTGDELRLPAGATLAARLISDIEAISLADQEGTETIPSYRALPFFEPIRIIAALGRRVFEAGPVSESVDYVHRTTAEYLGAAWLAQAVRNGLPVGRVVALMGVDGHPAPELRGLHAWLAVHLPEHAERLIDADPYGVLTYGDAASLSQPLCAHLIRALGRLSRTDPWFRSGNYGSPAIAGLARPDMIDEFRTVLRSPDAGFGLRGIVVEAAAMGTPLLALRDDLTDVLETSTLPYAERLYALIALLRLGDDGKASVVNICRTVLGQDLASLRLRAEAIGRLYGDPFGSTDVARLANDVLSSEHEVDVGVLWNLRSSLPLGELPIILDTIQTPAPDADAERRNVWEVASLFDRALLRILQATDVVDPVRLLAWLRKRRAFEHGYSGRNQAELRAALIAHPERLQGVLSHFLDGFVPDDNRWLTLMRFREAVFLEITPNQLIEGMLTAMASETVGSPRELFFYEAAFSLSYQEADGQVHFERLYSLADTRADLVDVRTRSVSAPLPQEYLQRTAGRRTARAEEPEDPDRLRRDFERDAAAIASGANLSGLIWAARVYLGIFDDVDRSITPDARFVPMLGDALASMALDGLVAALGRADVPSLNDVIELALQRRHHTSWHAYLAGISEYFRRTSSLQGLSDELLRAMLAFDLTNPVLQEDNSRITSLEHPWKQAVLRERLELARQAYEGVARAKLALGEQHPDGMRELLTNEAFGALREGIVLGLLGDFPNANVRPLHELLMAGLGIPSTHAALLILADRVLSGTITVDQPQRDLWLVIAWLLSPEDHRLELENTAQHRPDIVFDLRDFSGYSRNEAAPGYTASITQIEFLIHLSGSLYTPAAYPSGGWGGDRNPWDAAEYIRGLVSALSANVAQAATDALSRLASETNLAAYRPEIQHALANQRARRREAEYDRPDWPRTLRALDNKQPATVADLHAVLVEHLDDLRMRIRTENTDIYRMFWNLDGHGRLISPRPEEACRDDLITLLRPRLAPLGISLEPEGHMAGDRRADISAVMPARKILCEIKRDYHPDVWTAPDGQLERFYAHDPEALGFGIYLVFWFGESRPASIPAPPDGQTRPTSAAEMEAMLRARLPNDRAARTAVIVVDVTKPD
jgi:hypothetical protein